MKCKQLVLFLVAFLFFSCTSTPSGENGGPHKKISKITVNNKQRSLLVFYPQGAGPFPLLIAYHGHTGTATALHEITRFEKLWPQAIVVYPQGLTGDSSNKANRWKYDSATGWQLIKNDNDNRDILLFDAIVAYFVNEGIVDQQRIYIAGQSMGGAHSLLLWLTRGDKIAAFASCAGIPPHNYLENNIEQLPEKPFIMISGKSDETIPFFEQEKIFMVLKSRFPDSKRMVFYIHNGGHKLPVEAPSTIVSFFKEIDTEIITSR